MAFRACLTFPPRRNATIHGDVQLTKIVRTVDHLFSLVRKPRLPPDRIPNVTARNVSIATSCTRGTIVAKIKKRGIKSGKREKHRLVARERKRGLQHCWQESMSFQLDGGCTFVCNLRPRASVIDAARAFRFNMGSASDPIEFLISRRNSR